MYLTQTLTAALAVAGGVVASPTALEERKAKGLASTMISRGRKFIGTAVTFRDPPDEKEMAIYGNRNDFNSCVLEE
jgi:endo-1,4-beta-xylanase